MCLKALNPNNSSKSLSSTTSQSSHSGKQIPVFSPNNHSTQQYTPFTERTKAVSSHSMHRLLATPIHLNGVANGPKTPNNRASIRSPTSPHTDNDSGYDTDTSAGTAHNQFDIDFESHIGHSLTESPKYNGVETPREPFNIIGIHQMQKDLLINNITYHGLCKVFSSKIGQNGSYLDTAAILTKDRLYLQTQRNIRFFKNLLKDHVLTS